MIDVDVVDPHHHLWDLAAVHYPWLQEAAGQLKVHGDDERIRVDHVAADYRRDFAGIPIVRTVAVDGVSDDGLAEARWLAESAAKEGLPNGIVAGTQLGAPDIAATLEALADIDLARGVRQILNWHDDPTATFTPRPNIIEEDSFLAGFALLAPLGLSFDLQIYPTQLGQAIDLAQRFENTSIVLNHSGMLLGREPGDFEFWRDGMAALARCENVTVKVSGIGMTDHNWTTESLRPVVLATIDAFGIDKCMFASNWPVDTIYSSMADLYAAFDLITADFTRVERAKLFGTNADRVYRLT